MSAARRKNGYSGPALDGILTFYRYTIDGDEDIRSQFKLRARLKKVEIPVLEGLGQAGVIDKSLAEFFGVSRGLVTQWQTGILTPEPYRLVIMVQLLQALIDQLERDASMLSGAGFEIRKREAINLQGWVDLQQEFNSKIPLSEKIRAEEFISKKIDKEPNFEKILEEEKSVEFTSQNPDGAGEPHLVMPNDPEPKEEIPSREPLDR